MNSFFRVKPFQEAQQMLVGPEAPSLPKRLETVPLLAGLGRVLAENVFSPVDVPGFNRSMMDGYAVIAQDTFGAGEESPVRLVLAGEVMMGCIAEQPLQSGQAMAIATGAMLPENADAVVMVEYTEMITGGQAGDQTLIEITRAVAPGENRLRQGEDVAADQQVFARGTRLGPAAIGLLAALGITTVPVFMPPVVGLISTGDELVSPENNVVGARVRDINSYTLAALARKHGAEVRLYGIIPDEFTLLRETMAQALVECDIVCLSGGSSVGTRDLTQQVLASFPGHQILFHGLHLKPGKPTLAVRIKDKLVFGLPGHPASALTVFRVLVYPLLAQSGPFDSLSARIDRNVASSAGREEYLPVRLEKREDG
ncbi:MAG: molybdopterin molybdotransferase MoeA, partial [Heliobacteriaceae bacterium]|nr:molybdopterin molybdotransferase MoeA [Heliobacteriaceae bacterium]